MNEFTETPVVTEADVAVPAVHFNEATGRFEDAEGNEAPTGRFEEVDGVVGFVTTEGETATDVTVH